MSESDSGSFTQYGFTWGPMAVERLTHIEGRGRIVEVRTKHAAIEVYVSEKGRKIQVFDRPERAR